MYFCDCCTAELCRYMSQRDLQQMVIKSIETECIEDKEGVPFQIFYGISGNDHNFWSIANARKVIKYSEMQHTWALSHEDHRTYQGQILRFFSFSTDKSKRCGHLHLLARGIADRSTDPAQSFTHNLCGALHALPHARSCARGQLRARGQLERAVHRCCGETRGRRQGRGRREVKKDMVALNMNVNFVRNRSTCIIFPRSTIRPRLSEGHAFMLHI
jgi:hypothetical protein